MQKLLGSVNNHLYKSINLNYPPILDPHLEALDADLYALYRYFDADTRSSQLDLQTSGSSRSRQIDEPVALMHLVGDTTFKYDDKDEDNDTRECKKLFKNMKFFLSREVSLCSIL